ncbi:MAG: AMP-binding protein [Novosphingobium sp.]|nr:AMP-binding protein [Novosphingobium sp.]
MTETIPHILLETAAARPDHPAVVDRRCAVSYGELREAMLGFAAALARAGMAKGDRVGLWLPNCVEWAIACLGVQAAGGVVVPISTRFKVAEARHVLERAGIDHLVHVDSFAGIDFRDLLSGLGETLPPHCFEIAWDAPGEDGFTAAITEARDEDEARREVEARLAALTPDDISDIMFTSGTTGMPKGVVTNHGQNLRTNRGWNRATTLSADDRFLLLWPMSHCSGYKAGLVASILVGCTLLPEATLDVDQLVDRAIAEKVTFLPGPPNLFQAMLEARRRDPRTVPSLRVVGTGGTAIDPTLIRDVREQLGASIVYAGYGLTECCGTAAMIHDSDPPEKLFASTGRAIGGIELAVMSPSGTLLPPGEEGEVVTRGYHVMLGYLDDPAATAEAVDDQGWLHTGDLGKLDDDGFIAITGRAKEMFINGGFNCYPVEIELLMQAHPALREVAVFGVPNARLGEVGCAYVVWDAALEPQDTEALVEWARGQMANYKVPRHIRFIDALPRNAMGKVEKFRLIEMEQQSDNS